jgi:hypothetical protein
MQWVTVSRPRDERAGPGPLCQPYEPPPLPVSASDQTVVARSDEPLLILPRLEQLKIGRDVRRRVIGRGRSVCNNYMSRVPVKLGRSNTGAMLVAEREVRCHLDGR